RFDETRCRVANGYQQAKRRRYGDRDEVRLFEAVEVEKPDTVGETAGDSMSNVDGERRLADAARSAKRNEAAADEMIGYRQDIPFSPDDPCRSRRKVEMVRVIDAI